MNKDLYLAWGIVVIFIAACIGIYRHVAYVTGGNVEEKTVTFACDSSKAIQATFYIGDDTYVDLYLSDGRTLRVPHAMSGSGARYANQDESFVFWNKGDTAFITEGTQGAQTYSNCNLVQ